MSSAKSIDELKDLLLGLQIETKNSNFVHDAGIFN